MQNETQKLNILDYSPDELFGILEGQPSYRVKQIYERLLKGERFAEMTALPKQLREHLEDKLGRLFLKIKERLVSTDGTIKYLLELSDGAVVESVLMKYQFGATVCISTQVGCRMGCAFCVSTIGGLARNLTAGEMLAEVINASKELGERVTNVVLMGSGEPLDNYDNVFAFLKRANTELGISLRNISLSTCGIVPGILKLADSDVYPTLCISLHSAFNDKRQKLMPIAKKYTIEEIMDAASVYLKKSGRRVIIEYALVAGMNDSEADAHKLKSVLTGLNCHVNLIPVNEGTGSLKAPSKKAVYTFLNLLEKEGVSATVRRTLGADISGACGQLKAQRGNE